MLSRPFLQKTIRFTVAALMLTPVLAMGSEKIFVTVPGVPGESRFKGFEGQIDALNITLSATVPAGGKPTLAPVVISKPVDIATPLLMEALGKGTKLGTIVVRSTKTIGTSLVAVTTVTLTDARVVDWRMVDAQGSGILGTEQVSFAVTGYTVQIDQFDPASGNRTPGTPRSISVL